MCATAVGTPAAAQENSSGNHTVSLGAYFSEGDYGDTEETRVRYFPLSYEFRSGKWGLQLTVPHLEIEGLGNVLVNVGGVTPVRGAAQQISASGLGDSLLRATYQFDSSSETGPFFDLVLEAKIPTADEDEALGTGEYDYALQLDAFTSAGSATLFGTIGYRFRGDSELYSGLQDGAFVELGVSRPLTESVSFGLIYDYSEPASSYSKQINEFLPFISWQLSSSWSLMGYGVWGTTEDSPDVAFGAQLSFRW